jgi:hypothetical protein
MFVLILLPFWIAFHVLRLAGLLLFWTVVLLIMAGKAVVELSRSQNARATQRWREKHRYPLSLPDFRQAVPPIKDDR